MIRGKEGGQRGTHSSGMYTWLPCESRAPCAPSLSHTRLKGVRCVERSVGCTGRGAARERVRCKHTANWARGARSSIQAAGCCVLFPPPPPPPQHTSAWLAVLSMCGRGLCLLMCVCMCVYIVRWVGRHSHLDNNEGGEALHSEILDEVGRLLMDLEWWRARVRARVVRESTQRVGVNEESTCRTVCTQGPDLRACPAAAAGAVVCRPPSATYTQSSKANT